MGIWRVVLLLVVALVLWGLDQRNGPPPAKRPPAGKSAPAKPAVRGDYEEFTGCRLEEHRQNDGDSFHVRLPDGRVEQFRLYYVDAPESAFRTYGGGEDNHQRIREQAEDFGITGEQAVEIGMRAKQRVHDALARGPFTLHTAWDDPFGDRRYHAFIQPATGPLLHEMLVREGLAVVHWGYKVEAVRFRYGSLRLAPARQAGAHCCGHGRHPLAPVHRNASFVI